MKPWKLPDVTIEEVLKHTHADENACLVWEGKVCKGFPQYGSQARNLRRWIWEQENGRIRGKSIVCNRCKNALCINVDHMYLAKRGEVYDHNRDSEQHQGERNGRHVLTNEEVREIRKLRGEGSSLVYLASKFGISKTHVHRIVTNQSWVHI